MRNLPHLIYLEAFEAAARHLSFTRAAEELNCTQAAISQRVRALEQFFARPLFHRRSNGLELTEVGTAYLPGIAEALDRAEAATEGLLGAQAQTSVTVSAPLSFVTLWLAQHLVRFSAAHPQIEVRLNSTIWTDPNVELADLSILALDPLQPVSGAMQLGRERLILRPLAKPERDPVQTGSTLLGSFMCRAGCNCWISGRRSKTLSLPHNRRRSRPTMRQQHWRLQHALAASRRSCRLMRQPTWPRGGW
ncbi:LysR family transcriptional regulator [Mesorhizobium kowhaii]|uniref:HTH lysR-type domain-containing protein n=1 Tax=Mesorhizobium kowhaii TaxID=1300272 RepID=A0A2W7BUT6_9HYPH|nr:LysR family transcriptional regulator [Mesorhizobium kowhaii]PZV34665.1 hypothetical protein B5V02_31650 [Mesorhizobium kowhaii]